MLRIRSTWLAALGVSAVALLTAPVRAAELDVLTPSDAQVVVSFNLRQVADSPLAKKKGYVQKLKDLLDQNAEAKAVLKAVGLDPFKDIESVTMAMPIPENPMAKAEKVLVMVRGNFDQDKIEATLKADTSGKVKSAKEGTRMVYEFKGDETMFATFVNKNTIAAAPSKQYLLTALKGGGKPNAGLVKSVGMATGKESMWMGMILTEEMRKSIQGSPQAAAFATMESVTGTVNVTDAVTVDFFLNSDNADNAGKMKMQIDQFLPALGVLTGGDEKVGPIVKKIMNNLKVTVKGNAVNINIKFTEDIIDDIIKLSMMK